jgi:SAM-dependent methyltransferase
VSAWVAFWDSNHTIYVNARHRHLHYRRIAQDLRPYVPVDGEVLDYGCGEALCAELIAPPARRLILCEAAPKVRAGLCERYSTQARIEVLSPDQITLLPSAALDLVVMHSVAQYLSAEELDVLLSLFHHLLRSNGDFILGDVIPPGVSAATDALALLRFAMGKGFFAAAVFGLARTLASPYWPLRSRSGLTRYTEAAILEKLAGAGFAAQRVPNIGHNPARMTFLGRRS